MIEIQYRFHPSWENKAKDIEDFSKLTDLYLLHSAFGGDQFLVVNGFDCGIVGGYEISILDFAGSLFNAVRSLSTCTTAVFPYTIDEDEDLRLTREGQNVVVGSTYVAGSGLCDYDELLAAAADYAKRVLIDFVRLYPTLAMNPVLRKIYPVDDLGLGSLLR